MNEAIRKLKPTALWNYFADLNAVPRPSKKEERVIQFMKDFGIDLGLETMEERRGGDKKFKLTAGPGSVGKALGLTTKHSGLDLTGDKIWIMRCDENNVQIEPDRRVGVDYAQEDALLPWRFFEKDNPWVSVKKQRDH